MDAHGHDNLTPVRIYEVWPHMRDCEKPKSKDDWGFLEARTYCPPSKAHKRRLLRVRPRVTAPSKPLPIDAEPRHRQNFARSLGFGVTEHMRRLRLNVPYGPLPADRAAPDAVRKFITTPKPERGDDVWDADAIQANIDRLARDHERAVREAKGM